MNSRFLGRVVEKVAQAGGTDFRIEKNSGDGGSTEESVCVDYAVVTVHLRHSRFSTARRNGKIRVPASVSLVSTASSQHGKLGTPRNIFPMYQGGRLASLTTTRAPETTTPIKHCTAHTHAYTRIHTHTHTYTHMHTQSLSLSRSV
jgi:hypothetical protein